MASSLNGTGVAFSDGSTQAVAYSGVKGQVFTANGTFTIPSGITAVKVTVVGGGGGGANGGTGGGGGGSAVKFLTGLTPGNTLTVTRGAAASTSSVASGTQTITTVSATGGANGSSGGAGGLGSGGDMNMKGGNGGPSVYYGSCSPSITSYGLGGNSIFGGGGGSGAGGAYGGGGGAGGNTAGAAGVVVFEW